jgi:hypothetical protein
MSMSKIEKSMRIILAKEKAKTIPLGIRKQVAAAQKKHKAECKKWEREHRKAAKPNYFKKHCQENLEGLKELCLTCTEPGDLDIEAEKAMDAAYELVHAIDECNSETKDAVVAVVADILCDEERENGERAWGLSGSLHSALSAALNARGGL